MEQAKCLLENQPRSDDITAHMSRTIAKRIIETRETQTLGREEAKYYLYLFDYKKKGKH